MKSFALWISFSFSSLHHLAAAQSTCELALTCPGGFAVDNCVEQYCKYDCSPSCCGLSNLDDIRTCLGGGTPNSAASDQNHVVCGTAINIISSCSSAIPTFSAAPVSQLEKCLCYDSDGTFDPSAFDNGIDGCNSYFATAQTSLLPVVSEFVGFCTNSQAAAAPSTTAVQKSNQATASSAPLTTSPQTQNTAGATSAAAKSSQTGSAASISPGPESAIGMLLSFMFSLLYIF